MTAPQPRRAPLSEASLRWLWRKYYAAKSKHGIVADIQAHRRRVAIPAAVPWLIFGLVCASYGYDIQKLSMWVVRNIGKSNRPSQHSYGATGDVNYYLNGLNGYNYGWSWRKTDFSPELVDALLAIRTVNGKQVFAWGGTWRTKQDYMHWYPGCGPKDMLTGINYGTVVYGEGETPPEGKDEPMIRRGHKGEAVVTIQEGLIYHGYNLRKWGADGDFGAETEEAVKAFQAQKGLIGIGVVDGVVDGVTASFLLSYGSGSGGSIGPVGPRGPKGDTPSLVGYKLVFA